jgi:hypothetical protein
MKPSFPLCLLVLLLAIPVFSHAQDDSKPILIGPTIGINAGVNLTNYGVSGVVRNVAPGSAFGVMADFPVSSATSVVATLQYYTIAFSDENKFIDDPTHDIELGGTLVTEGHFGYISLATMFKAGGFMFGFQFGIPVDKKISNSNKSEAGGNVSSYVGDITPASGDVNFLVEGRIGGEFTFLKTNSGELRFGITCGYPFTKMAAKTSGKPVMDSNFRIPSVMMNVAWMFNFFK